MKCLCGCGRKISRGQTRTNLLAGEVALELIIWDKARSLRSPVAAAEIEGLLSDGAPYYQELLAHLHADRQPSDEDLKPVNAWLQRSREARQRIGEELPVVPKKKTKLSPEEAARVDRVHPERSFTGESAVAVAEPPAARAARAAAPASPLETELIAVLEAPDDEFEDLAVSWLGRLVAERSPSLDELRWLLGRLEDVRSGRIEEAEPALRRFLAAEQG